MLVATAGHVDHGKTSLVQRLTGTDTDRLAEEKQRGLTIELGYAFRAVEGQETIGFIDVPGHHRFINTMISGINAIDLGMLVVAADDGPMPQTIEHLQLLRILGVERFLAVITKCDLVDRGRLNQVIEQLTSLLPGAPLCEVSNRNGDGLDQLTTMLEKQSKSCPQRITESQFRLYVDRAFVKKGAGIVVTGTCLSGSINAGDELHLHTFSAGGKSEIRVRVRAIHTQGSPATNGHAGQRCALNLSGKVSLQAIRAGDFLCAHPSAVPHRRLDTRCWMADDSERRLKHLGRVKLYIGTRRVGARSYLLDRHDLGPAGHRVQLILDSGVLAFSGDRFVLRDDNESRTLGGGVVIDPQAPQWGKSRESRLRTLDALESGRPVKALEQLLIKQGDIVSLSWCKRTWNLSQKEIDELLASQVFVKESLMRVPDKGTQLILCAGRWETYIQCIDESLAQWHSERPMEPGIRPDVLRSLLRLKVPSQLFQALLDERVRAGQIIYQEQLLRALGHKPSLSPQVQRDWKLLETQIKARGFNLPLRSELQKDTGFDAKRLEGLTRPAIKTGDILEIGEKRLALPATLRELAQKIENVTNSAPGISVIEAKGVFGLGRNLTIEILEFFDQIGYTKRRENLRVIADPKAILPLETR